MYTIWVGGGGGGGLGRWSLPSLHYVLYVTHIPPSALMVHYPAIQEVQHLHYDIHTKYTYGM